MNYEISSMELEQLARAFIYENSYNLGTIQVYRNGVYLKLHPTLKMGVCVIAARFDDRIVTNSGGVGRSWVEIRTKIEQAAREKRLRVERMRFKILDDIPQGDVNLRSIVAE